LLEAGNRCGGELAWRRLDTRFRHVDEVTAAKIVEQGHEIPRFFIPNHGKLFEALEQFHWKKPPV